MPYREKKHNCICPICDTTIKSIIHRTPFPTSQRTESINSIKTKYLMLCKIKIGIYFDNHVEQKDNL